MNTDNGASGDGKGKKQRGYEIKPDSEAVHVAAMLYGAKITGNVIPRICYRNLATIDKRGKKRPATIAINVRAELLFWYRPIEEKDDKSGKITLRKRYKGEYVQKSVPQLADDLGFTEDQVKRALTFLEQKNLIRRIIKVEKAFGQYIKIVYIALNAREVIRITDLNANLGAENSPEASNQDANLPQANSDEESSYWEKQRMEIEEAMQNEADNDRIPY